MSLYGITSALNKWPAFTMARAEAEVSQVADDGGRVVGLARLLSKYVGTLVPF